MATDESLVEMNIHEMLLNLSGMGLALVREAAKAISSFDYSQLKKIYPKLRDSKDRLENTRILFMEYIVRVASTHPQKDLYASLILKIDRIMQRLDGATYRFMVLLEKHGKLEKTTTDILRTLIDRIEKQYDALYNALEKLRYKPKESIIYVENIGKIENEIDEIYRALELEIFEKYSNDIISLMLLKDIADLLEDAADMAKEAGEQIRYIALHKTV